MGPMTMKASCDAGGKDRKDAATKASASEQTESRTARIIIPAMARGGSVHEEVKEVIRRKDIEETDCTGAQKEKLPHFQKLGGRMKEHTGQPRAVRCFTAAAGAGAIWKKTGAEPCPWTSAHPGGSLPSSPL